MIATVATIAIKATPRAWAIAFPLMQAGGPAQLGCEAFPLVQAGGLLSWVAMVFALGQAGGLLIW